jgi:hypothetical protein
VYYFTNKGAEGLPLFPDREAARFFRGRLPGIAQFEMLRILACRLTKDAYHLLVMQDGCEPAIALPKQATASYCKYYNKRYARKGAVFGKAFQWQQVERGWDVTRLYRLAFPEAADGDNPAWISESVSLTHLYDYVEEKHAEGWKDDVAELLEARGSAGA